MNKNVDGGKYQYYSKGKVSSVHAGYLDMSYPITEGMSGGPTVHSGAPGFADRYK